MENILKQKSIFTSDPIINCDISYDSTRVIVVTKNSEYHYTVIMFDINTYEQTFSEVIGGDPSQYIKMKTVAQNYHGDKYALTYIDDGKFRIRTFEKE